MKLSLYVILLVAFIDLMGMGLVYPLFSSMLFDSSCTLLSSAATQKTRGLCLGLLLSLMPIAQFFSSPIWGAISDSKGRKKPLLLSLAIGIAGYLLALCSIFFTNIFLLFFSRIIVGCSAGNISIVQAAIADLSSQSEKTKNFGLYSMALGSGFTLGPFFGGTLSSWNYSLPFLFAVALVISNLVVASLFFKETHHTLFTQPLAWHIGLSHLKKAFRLRGTRIILLSSFLHNFAWSYFFEFIPVYLITQFAFSPLNLGFFYAIAGGIYAITTGLLIRPFVKYFKASTLFFAGNLFTALTILTIPFLPSSFCIWLTIALICYFVGFVMPTSTTLVSDSTCSRSQGEALGILASVNAAALGTSPLLSGSLVGNYPTLPMWIGGTLMLLVALLLSIAFGKKLFELP